MRPYLSKSASRSSIDVLWDRPSTFRLTILSTNNKLPVALSRRQKNILQFSPKFHQFCTDLHGIQIRWNFCEIFFRFKDMAFYLVLNFFNSAQTYYVYYCLVYVIFVKKSLKKSYLKSQFSGIQIRLNFFHII